MKLFAEIKGSGKAVSKSDNECLIIELKSADRLSFMTMAITSLEGFEYPVVEIMGIVPKVLEQLKRDIAKFDKKEIEM